MLDYKFLKIHYFLFNAGLACVIPYLPVHAKDIGISAAAVGFIYCILPIVTMILKPSFGALADHFNCLSNFMRLLLCVVMLTAASTVSIPRKQTMINSIVHCSPNGTNLYFRAKPSPSCSLDKLVNQEMKCYMHCSECVSKTNSPIEKTCAEKVVHTVDINTVLEKSGNASHTFSVKYLNIVDRRMNTVCLINVTFNCQSYCDKLIQDCFVTQQEPEYSSEQFMLFLIFATLCVSLSGVATSFSDAICFNELGENAHLYGKQRLWGTIGWGLFSPLAGYCNNSVSGDNMLKSYQPGAILHLVIMITDLYFIGFLKTKNMKFSQNVCKDVGKVFCSFKILAFMLSVFVIGTFTALMWSFLFWHLAVLGSSKLLFGLVPTIQCLIGELPFFFFSGFLISKLGHFNILGLSLITFGFRFIGYSFITNPWFVLPIELLQGPTYGLFYAAMASFANSVALPGTETTVQGLVGSAFDFGMVLGNIWGGLVMQSSGGAVLFFWAGIVSFAYCIFHTLLSFIVRILDKKKERTNQQEVAPVAEESVSFM